MVKGSLYRMKKRRDVELAAVKYYLKHVESTTELLLMEDIEGKTALHTATATGNDEVVEYLCSLELPELVKYQDKVKSAYI